MILDFFQKIPPQDKEFGVLIVIAVKIFDLFNEAD